MQIVIDLIQYFKFTIFHDYLLFVLMEATVRTCVREAIKYKRNKKQIKAILNNMGPVKRLLRLYFPAESYAPNNMRYFQVFRIINTIGLCTDQLLFAVLEDHSIWEYLLCARILILYVPFLIYNFYAILMGPPGEKNIDFNIFKNP